MAGDRETRLAARQAVYEASPLPDETVSAAFGWSLATLRKEVRRGGWRKGPASRAELARRTRGLIERRLAAIDARLASEKKLSVATEKALAEEALKIHNTLNGTGFAGKNEEDSAQERMAADEQLTEMLHRIDGRIAELAGQRAAELVARQHSGQAGAGGAGELADAGAGAPAGAHPSA